MGAVSVSDIQHLGGWALEQHKKAVLAKVTMSASYATNGDTLDPATTLGLRRVTGMFIASEDASKVRGTTVAKPVKGYNAQLAGTAAAPKIKLVKGGTTDVEETNATNVATHIFWAIFIGEQ